MAALAGFGRQRAPKAGGGLLAIPLALIVGLSILAVAYVVYVLWPRWPGPAVAVDSPPLPITVAGVTFNVPPAAIRNNVQRRAGAQERIDLVYLWPTLAPPPPKAVDVAGKTSERIFVTISTSDGTLPPEDRLKVIYPRYIDAGASKTEGGLALVPFRDGTPYQGEDLVFDPAAPDRFLLRCTRKVKGPMPGTCLHERRMNQADIVVRFPRDWLADWKTVQDGIARLLTQMRPHS